MRKILVLAASPADSSPLQLAKEVHLIKEGLLRSRHRDDFEFITEWAVTARGLRRALLDHQPEFIHFSGHGSREGITLEDESGAKHRVGADALAELVAHFAENLRCVLLNSCNSQPQAEAISHVIPYAIGMRGTVADEAAIEFAVGFYDAVGAGRMIDEAFALGRNALSGKPDYSLPVLYQRRAADGASSPAHGKGAPDRPPHGNANPGSETKEGAQIGPFFQFLQTALRLGLQSGGGRLVPRIVGAVLYAAVVTLLFAALFWLRDPGVLRIAFFALISLLLLIFVLLAWRDLHPYVANFLAAVVTVCLVGAIVWGAVKIADLPVGGEPAPGPQPATFRAAGRIRFQDHQPAEGVEVSIPLLRLSDRTNVNGTFYLGQIEYRPGHDTVDLQIGVGGTMFQRRVALDAASFDIVLAQPRPKPGADTIVPQPEDTIEPSERLPPSPGPDAQAVVREAVMREAEPRRAAPTTGSVAGHVNAAIGGEQYKHFGMTVAGPGTCRLRGRVQVLRGGNRDVHIVVLTAEEFELYRVKGPYSEIFRERNTSDYTLDVELPGPGRYELVVSNRTSWLTPKYVLVENVRWECAEAGS